MIDTPTKLTHGNAYGILKILFKKKDGTQIYEESEYNHYFLDSLRIFYPELDELWRLAESSTPTRNALEARKKIGQILIQIGTTLSQELKN
jgi:hypothetical protein